MPRNPNGFVWTRVPENRRAKRGYRVDYYQGGSMHAMYATWAHYDAACDYLTRAGLALNDVGEVLVNFDEDELVALNAEASESMFGDYLMRRKGSAE